MNPEADRRFRRILLSAVLCPLLLFAAFAAFAWGQPLVALVLVVAWEAVSLLIPHRPSRRQPIDREDLVRWNWLRLFILAGFVFWLHSLPEMRALEQKLTSGVLHRWEGLAATAVWCAAAIYQNCHILRKLGDEQVADYSRGRGEVSFDGGLLRRYFFPRREPVRTAVRTSSSSREKSSQKS